MKRRLISSNNKDLIFVCLFWAMCFCTVIFLLFRYGNELLDSDVAADMVLSAKMIEEKSFLPTDWYYGKTLRVFNVQQFYVIGLLLSPNNWHIARVIGSCIMLLCLSLGVIFLGQNICGTKTSIFVSALIMCPFSYWNEFYVVMSGTYLPYMILIMLAYGIFIRLHISVMVGNTKRGVLWCALGFILAILCGLNGVRMALYIYAPAFLALVIYIVFYRRQWRNYIQYTVYNVIIFLGFLIGYLIYSQILSEKYVFVHMEDQSWSDLSLERVIDSLGWLLDNFGYPKDPLKTDTVKLMSIDGILGAAWFGTAFIFVISIWRLAKRFKKLSGVQQILYLIAVSSIFLMCVSQSMLTVEANGSYWLAIMPVLILVIGIEFSTEDWKTAIEKQFVYIVLTLCIFSTSVSCMHQAIVKPSRAVSSLKPIAEWLEAQNYQNGVSDFWNSSVVTVWTNGKIEMWTVNNFDDMEIQESLQSTEHNSLPDDFFIIAYDNIEELCTKYDKQVVYTYSWYSILA